MLRFILIILLLGFIFFNFKNKRVRRGNQLKLTQEVKVVENTNIKAIIKTNKGDINLTLFPELAPVTVANFVNLSRRGYYNGLKFHRVIADFMVQGGCPLGTGTGGPGYNFQDEIHAKNIFDRPGLLAMANAGPGTNGSQFFITHVPTEWLNKNHTIFGEVVAEGDQEVVNSIAQGDIIEEVILEGDVDSFISSNEELFGQLNEALSKDFPKLVK